ncbi:hypothetical protein BGZ63DRAFT_369617 [Mariannaea sp. PMI_226]|nr:hypothetical protein BGZ63DRAFT_369617 [Mariannaea sp. PMI_226]
MGSIISKLNFGLKASNINVSLTLHGGTTGGEEASEPSPSEIRSPLPDTPTLPLTSFPYFRKLPPELRVKIWEYSLSVPRIFWLLRRCSTEDALNEGSRTAVRRRTKKWIPCVINHKPPAPRQTCREARRVSERCGILAFGVRQGRIKSLWFNPVHDIVYIHHKFPLDNYKMMDNVIDCAENVAIDAQLCRNYKRTELEEIFCEWNLCKRIILVHSFPGMAEGDIDLFPLGPDERACSRYTVSELQAKVENLQSRALGSTREDH